MTERKPASGIEFTLFIPCLNEAPRIEGTLATVQAAMREVGRSYEILVVDDGSTDGTGEVVQRYAKAHPELPIRLQRNEVNQGVAYSFVEAAFVGRGEYFRLIWGDNVEPKETLVKILSLAGQADLIIPYYPEVPGKSAFRMMLSSFYTRGVNVISGFDLHYYNGSVLCQRYAAMRWSPHNHGFTGFLADLITQLLAEGASCIEVPVSGRHVDKGPHSSPLTFHNFVSTGLTMLSIFQRRFSYWVFRHRLVRLRRNPQERLAMSSSVDSVID
jgi:glycosyltransferase involved in cell wall biosynthesis